MANHILSLDIPTVTNTCVMKIFDTSVYQTTSPNIPIVCPTLTITVPGFGTSIEITGQKMLDFVETGHINLTACDLGLQTQNCGSELANIPDGIYAIKYSVSPNNLVFAEYNYLRISQALNKYYKVLCGIDLAACDPPAKVKEKLEKLRMVRMYLDAAKSKVELCHEPKKCMTLYNYEIKHYNKIDCVNI